MCLTSCLVQYSKCEWTGTDSSAAILKLLRSNFFKIYIQPILIFKIPPSFHSPVAVGLVSGTKLFLIYNSLDVLVYDVRSRKLN